MTTKDKQQYFKDAELLLDDKRGKISQEMLEIPLRLAQIKELKDGSTAGELTYLTLIQNSRKKFDQLQGLYPSPYFNCLKIIFNGEDQQREIYFGKFPFMEENIYSWTSPIAALRFEAPGQFEFKVDGQSQSGQILLKDQYLINDGRILFLATEQIDAPRELIYQEYFSQRKTDFILPEIVAQMEKAQDEVIRAKAEGALVISGPAGSGKTTLALHRVAYLLQSPDTADLYSQEKIIVFVQDTLTKSYFAGLLPSFGIKDVSIVTFGEWALEVLNLPEIDFVSRFLDEEQASNDYEAIKNQAMKSGRLPTINKKDVFKSLADFYYDYFKPEHNKYFIEQKKTRKLDRFDLTLLLLALSVAEPLTTNREYYQVGRNQSISRKSKRGQADYSLIVLDEFENYLPEQVTLIKSTLNPKQSSILYVGDLKQRIYFGAVEKWEELGEEFNDYDQAALAEHKHIVRLQKVYRNTKEILTYVASLGYQIEIPESLKSGKPVEEVSGLTIDQELEWVKARVAILPEISVGILAREKSRLAACQTAFNDRDNIKVMSIREAQGVEFDVVFILGVNRMILKNEQIVVPNDKIGQEFKRIDRDLLYIALTRAMNELYVSVE